jgi:hypothetical protein
MKLNNIPIQLAFIFAASLLVGCSHHGASAPATPEEQARFLTAVRQAYDKHDTNDIFTLVCWDGVSDKDTDGLKKMLVREVAEKVSEMTLIDPDPKISDEWKDKDGIGYHSNLPVIKRLSIYFAPGGDIRSDLTPVGEKDGKLFLVGPIPIK